MKQYLLFLRSVLLFLLLAVGAGQVMADEETPTTYTVTFGSVPAAGGTVTAKVVSTNTGITSGSSVDAGSDVEFSYTENDDYRFDGWYFTEACTGDKITGDHLTLTEISANRSVYAKFLKIHNNITLTTPSDNSYSISINSGATDGKAEYGATVNFSVTPAAGYFLKLVVLMDENNNAVAFTKQSDGTYSFVMPSARVTISAAATKTVTGTLGTDYTVDNDGNITILTSGQTVTGTVNGNIIIKNEDAGATIDVTFDNVQTLNANKQWSSSIIISNTGGTKKSERPKITIKYIGTNAFVNSNAHGFVVNPKTKLTDGTYTNNHKPCNIYFESQGEATLYIGSNNSNYKALLDDLGDSTPNDEDDDSYIKFNNLKTRYDKLFFSYSTVNASSGNDEPSWEDEYTITNDEDNFDLFISNCKSRFQFVKFKINQLSDTRTAPAGWLTICYPYSGTVTNGAVYEVFGRVMWREGDPELTEKRGELGRLKHLVLTLRDGDNKTKFEAGKPYFIKKKSGETNIVFAIDETSTYTPPTKFKGFIGVYAQKTMEPESFFLSGSQMAQVRPNSTQNLIPEYRAYFPWVSETENFLALVPEYSVDESGQYLVYGHATGTGGTDSGKDYQHLSKISINDVVILGEEETTEIMNNFVENRVVSSGLYDLMGRKVQTPKKGSLYIMNGKKVIY